MQTILKNKVSKVVPADELDCYTENGWEVVEGFDQDDLVNVPVATLPSQMPEHLEPYPPSGLHRSVASGYKVVTVRRRHYLVVHDRGKVLEDLHGQLEELGKKANDHYWEREKAKDAHEKALEELQKELAREQELRGSVEKTRDLTIGYLENMRNQNHRLEQDLGKLRKAIGNLKFKEIVGERKDEDDDDLD